MPTASLTSSPSSFCLNFNAAMLSNSLDKWRATWMKNHSSCLGHKRYMIHLIPLLSYYTITTIPYRKYHAIPYLPYHIHHTTPHIPCHIYHTILDHIISSHAWEAMMVYHTILYHTISCHAITQSTILLHYYTTLHNTYRLIPYYSTPYHDKPNHITHHTIPSQTHQ